MEDMNLFDGRLRLDSQHHARAISFIRSGMYLYNSGNSTYLTERGNYLTKTVTSTINVRSLLFYANNIQTQLDYYARGYGMSIRCLVRWSHWQLPTYSGTKSYQNLLVGVYGMTTATGDSTYRINVDSQLQLVPFNFIHSGDYSYYSGNIFDRSNQGYYWQTRAVSETGAKYLLFYSTYLNPQYNANKGAGFSLRCLGR